MGGNAPAGAGIAGRLPKWVQEFFDARWKKAVWVAGGIVAVILVCHGWYYLFRQDPDGPFSSEEQLFKYGSLSKNNGFPIYVLEVLPELFPKHMPDPGDWTGFGLIVEDGNTLPIGWSRRTVGFPGMNVNCALCHTGTYRTSREAEPQLVLGGPAHEFDFGAFQEFLFKCVADDRYCPDVIIPAIEKRHDLKAAEKVVYRVLVKATKMELLKMRDKMAWAEKRPAAGPGRTDAFNTLKFVLLDICDDGSVASSEFLPLWDQAKREGMGLHWNGCGTDLREENLISGFSVVTKKRGLEEDHFDRVTKFLATLPPPKFPFEIDAALADRGKAIYGNHCARCHAFGGAETGKVTKAAEVGTDPEFLKVMTPELVKKLKKIDTPPFVFETVKITDGYVNVPLDGLWFRAPYLHNGSVPTLVDLLNPPTERPVRFLRGGNVYDPEAMGFVEGTGKVNFEFDTTAKGNGNGGHVYGTELPADEKRALLEYLKTL